MTLCKYSFDIKRTTEVVKDPHSGLVEFFNIITLTNLANWDKWTKFPVNPDFLYLLCTKVISKGKIYETIWFNNTVQLGLYLPQYPSGHF